MRFLPFGLLALLSIAPTAIRGAEERLTLTSIIAGERVRPLGSEDRVPGAGAILAAAAGVDRLPVPCATPIVQDLARAGAGLAASLSRAREVVLGRPAGPFERLLASRDGRFAVHYGLSAFPSGLMAADRDRNGHPDLADRVLESLAAAASLLEARLGYPAPAARLDTYLADLGYGLEGYAVGGGAAPFLVLDSGLPADRVLSAALHQSAHASLQRLVPGAPAWWGEGSAAYLTLAGAGDLTGYEMALRARLETPGRTLATEDLTLLPGSLLWPLYLAESRSDPGVVRSIWEEMARSSSDPLAAAETVLARAGSSLSQAFREFCLWNLFTGERDDGLHYPDGRRFPRAALTTVGPGLPFVIGPVEPVEPLGSVAFRLPAEPRRGTLDMNVRVEGGLPAPISWFATAARRRGRS